MNVRSASWTARARTACGLATALCLGAAASARAEDPAILSAYFGLDEASVPLVHPFRLTCADGDRIDGLPLVLSHEVDQATIEPQDFLVHTQSGKTLQPNCATTNPAGEEDEDRTVLLLGELGDWPSDPPVSVEIVGEVLSEPESDGTVRSFKGLVSPAIPPYTDGPMLVMAEIVPNEERELSEAEGGPNCPAGRTLTIVRLIWSGGVSQFATDTSGFPPGRGAELGPAQYGRITVDLLQANGEVVKIHPFYVGDRDDGDNNNDLCLDRNGVPVAVAVRAKTVTDPMNDWNPATEIEISK
ncbi:MAG: hypothetical protein H6923_06980 [Alphaproteobacteria bacterium]|nr:hypothetical protein [Alphaproteobacteria bacterium]